jgi:hypothetical protein
MKTCSYCGHQNEDSATRCVECNEDFPVPEPVEPGLTDPNKALAVVATFGDSVEASVIKARLEAAGIEACIPEELDPSPFGNFPPLARVTVRVAEEDLAAAKEVLSQPAEPE